MKTLEKVCYGSSPKKKIIKKKCDNDEKINDMYGFILNYWF